MKPHEQAIYRFGEFILMPSERRLLRHGKPVALTGKAFDLLVVLVRQSGHLVTKDELLRAVWPAVVVEEVNLSVNVSALRKVLGAAPEGEWIETVPRQGYRFQAAVELADGATALEPAPLRDGLIARASTGLSRDADVGSMFPRRRAALLLAGMSAAALAILGVSRWQSRSGRAPYPSVAVLPFGADEGQGAYLTDGVAEAVINGLTRFPELRVSPRASAFRFKDALGDPAAAGRALDAAAVVTGSLSQTRDAIRLQLELVDVARNAQVWSKAYEVAPGDLPKLEARVLRDLAGALQVGVSTGVDEATTSGEPTASAPAYQAYLQGRFLWNQRSEASLHSAIVQFRRAIELDPRFALAHAALADAHTTLGYLGFVAPAGTFPVARPYALKALELDPSLAQAHASLAYIKFYFDWDWEGARDEFLRAISLNPNDAVSHQWYAVYLLASGRPDHAFGEIQTAHRLDPLSLAINTDIGFHHYYNGRYPEAVAQFRAVLDMKSDFMLAHLWLARALLELGRFDAALAETAVAEAKARQWSVLVAARGFTYAMAGMTSEARMVLREMQSLSAERFVTAYGIALVHAGLGQSDEAFRSLEMAFEERSHWLVWLRLDPRWKSLRNDPRFAALLTRLKYPV
ncbi:MAG TPA: winged helix-turn-helix domain-containing protein [Caldimonas sp.]|jgi:DNA-binding winged helix-turn-helix (wHTH) protein/TolB-like protein/Tfp pilus assembly protein PilF|nr:winged helix-turn-helix domain-containing protein [Caldimonas sp.]HEV7578311.1 winged helix-turn-helix domain-containing protein [Caldimonas sp.]